MLELVTAAAVEPVLIDEVKDYLRVDGDTEDALISALIITAREHLEGRDGMLGRALVRQTWDWTFDYFPPGKLKVPLPPLISVTSITYQSNGSPTEETYSSASYTVKASENGGQIYPNYGTSWPTTLGVPNAITVRFIAGYGGSWNDVPAPIRLAMQYLIRHWYDNREAFSMADFREVPATVEALVGNYRVRAF